MNDDLISRQAILGKIRDYIEEYSDLEPNGEHNLKWCAMREAEEVVLTEPPAQAEQRTEKRTGHWFDVGSLSCRCSECGCKSTRESGYCPNCGAKMELLLKTAVSQTISEYVSDTDIETIVVV